MPQSCSGSSGISGARRSRTSPPSIPSVQRSSHSGARSVRPRVVVELASAGQTKAVEQRSKSGIGAERVEHWICLERRQFPRSSLDRLLKRLEGAILVAQAYVDDRL